MECPKFGYVLTNKAKAENIPPTVIFVDTETREAADGRLTLALGCYERWTVEQDGLPVADGPDESGAFWTESEFYELVSMAGDCRVIAHNWQFDAAVLRVGAADNMSAHAYSIDVNGGIYPAGNQGFSPFLMRLVFPGGAADLLCNTNFYKMPLATLGKSLGIAKLEMPDVDDADAMLIYCQRDTEILREAYFAMFRYTRELAGITPGITAAMAAMRVFRKGFYTPDKDVQGSQHLDYITKAERAAYHGGRTDTFYKGTPHDTERIYKYDVNSLYPSVMIGDMPVRYLEPAGVKHIGTDGTIALVDATLNIPADHPLAFIGLEGVKDADGQLIFPAGRFRCWLWQPLYEIAAEQDYVETVHKVLMYDAEPLFDAYVNGLYQRRREYKEAGNAAFDLLTKLMLNSLYGKFGQRQSARWELVPFNTNEYAVMAEPETDDMRRFTEIYELAEWDYWQLNRQLYRAPTLPDLGVSKSAVVSIAGYVAAKGRAVLWRALAAVVNRGGQLFLCDTDSVVSDVPLPAAMVSSTELGKWKLESEPGLRGEDCTFWAPKHYQIGGVLKMKGVREPVPGATVHPQAVFPKFMTDLMGRQASRRERLQTGAVIRYMEKKVTGLNRKRLEQGDDLPTLPIVL